MLCNQLSAAHLLACQSLTGSQRMWVGHEGCLLMLMECINQAEASALFLFSDAHDQGCKPG